MADGERKMKSLKQRKQELTSNIQQIRSDLEKLERGELDEILTYLRSALNQTLAECPAGTNIDSSLILEPWTYNARFSVETSPFTFVGLFPLATYCPN